jgi:hypothetical protein
MLSSPLRNNNRGMPHSYPNRAYALSVNNVVMITILSVGIILYCVFAKESDHYMKRRRSSGSDPGMFSDSDAQGNGGAPDFQRDNTASSAYVI